jgi:hypothetical protein
MLRTIVALLAALAVGPLACDDGYPGDDADDTTSEGTTGDEESTGEAIEPTPIPFQPPLRKECTRGDKSTRVRDCDP